MIHPSQSSGRDESSAPPMHVSGAGRDGSHIDTRIGHVTRRQMTVAFCDLVGSTELVTRVDPEDMLDILSAYRELVQRVVARFEGYIANFIGDGVDVYFGFPIAGEDDAVRAIYASLEIVTQARKLLRDVSTGNEIQVRVGIATGMVAIGGQDAPSIAGETPHLAARIQAVAQPGQVVLSPSTRRIAGAQFEYVDLGPFDFKGFDRPVRISAVEEVRTPDSRSAWRGHDEEKPLAGREVELAALIDTCRGASRATGVLVVADPGMGKSHLATAVAQQLARHGATLVRLQCSPFQSNSALEPFAQHVARSAGFIRTDTPESRREKLEAQLAVAGLVAQTDLDLLSSLVGLPMSAHGKLRDSSPPVRLQMTKEAMLRYFDGLTRAHFPVLAPAVDWSIERHIPLRLLLVIEDLHWMDPTSLELVRLMLAALDAPVAFLMTARTEFNVDLGSVQIVRLDPLPSEAAHLIASRVASGTRLPRSVLDAIVEHTDGVPLYVEELTRMMIDTADCGPDGFATRGAEVPETLMDLLMERLDRLGAAKWLAQVASVIGHEFDSRLLNAASGLSQSSFDESINSMLDAGLATPTDGTGEHFAFKHALMQDTAYVSTSARTRERLHARVADLLLGEYGDSAERQPERVARHMTLAGKPLQASRYWLLAGEQALGRGAPREAAAHLSTGVQSLARVPPDPTRSEAELALLSMLGPTTMVLKGPGSVDFRDVQRRAHALCHELPGHPRQFPITYGLCLYHWGRAELSTARNLADELLEASRMREDDDEAVMAAHNMSGMVSLSLGHVAQACAHLERSVARYEANRHAALYPVYLMDFGVFGRFYLAVATFIAGDTPRAIEHTQDAYELAQRLNQPHTLGFSMVAKCTVALLCRQPDEALRAAAECIEFASRMGFSDFVGLARIARGWATATNGDVVGGLADLEAGVRLWNATGFENWQSWFGVLRAELLALAGRRDDALSELAHQISRIDKSGEDLFRSQILARRGALLRDEKLIEEASAIAQAQGAVGWIRHIEAQRRSTTVPTAAA